MRLNFRDAHRVLDRLTEAPELMQVDSERRVRQRLRIVDHRHVGAIELPVPRQFLRDLHLIAASLKANKGFHAGWGNVQRLIRRVETFGFHLAALDLRQTAEVHHQVIGQGLDDPQWLSRSPAERHDLLVNAIERDAGVKVELDALGKRTLGVFEAILQARHRYGPAAVGYYIVSSTQGADDVLAPLLLARWAGTDVGLNIVPLFETVDDLEAAPRILAELFGLAVYRKHLAATGTD